MSCRTPVPPGKPSLCSFPNPELFLSSYPPPLEAQLGPRPPPPHSVFFLSALQGPLHPNRPRRQALHLFLLPSLAPAQRGGLSRATENGGVGVLPAPGLTGQGGSSHGGSQNPGWGGLQASPSLPVWGQALAVGSPEPGRTEQSPSESWTGDKWGGCSHWWGGCRMLLSPSTRDPSLLVCSMSRGLLR